MKLYTAGGSIANRKSCIKLGVGILLVDGWRDPTPYPYFAIDNGCYSAWSRGIPWDPSPFLKILSKARELGLRPDFAVLPDIVAGGHESVKRSMAWYPVLKAEYPDVPLYFAVQDGMTADDIPYGSSQIDGIFVGGSMEWKLRTMGYWSNLAHEIGIQCHVGRIGTPDRMVLAHTQGVDSIDSTTWVQRNGSLERHIGKYLDVVKNQTQISTRPEPSYKPISKMSEVGQEYI